ncbi:hypothetical protein BS17DRAFT_774545 [Gyrodon lividus]|nr:hypothetical protein BS17DRAFT_774545 [Gyrodon lividus]
MRSSRVSSVYDTDSPSKSLTPQRKHRKLLKDGSSEVWPEEIERVFVQGLREYWESPWATYSRGRSRWRNQFLVDYLQKNGVDRSKKQVASHIQVLRNMWKGEPEYHLVAGGEELFLETGLLAPVKAEELPDGHLLTPVGFDDHSPVSDRSGSSAASACAPRSLYPGSSPTVGSTTELALPHPQGARMPAANDNCRRVRSFSTSECHRTDARRLSPLASSCWTSDLGRPTATQSCPTELYTALGQAFDFTLQYSPEASQQPNLSDSPLLFTESSLFSTEPLPCPVGLTRLSLWAEGMSTFSLPVDALVSSTQPLAQSAPAIALRIKLHLPPIDAPRSPALHGFQGSVTCTVRPSSSIRCSTTVLVRNQCISRESHYCSLMTAEPTGHDQLESVTLLLPDSPLSRSRWLDSTSPTCIVQKIIVNEEVVAVIFYDLDRGQCESMPSAELSGVQKYHGRAERTPSPLAAYHTDSLLPSCIPAPGQCIPRSSLPIQTSLSYALTSINADASPRGTSSYSAAFMMPSLLS